MKTWATIIWISKDTHYVVVQLDNGEGSVFENEESDLEVGESYLQIGPRTVVQSNRLVKHRVTAVTVGFR